MLCQEETFSAGGWLSGPRWKKTPEGVEVDGSERGKRSQLR